MRMYRKRAGVIYKNQLSCRCDESCYFCHWGCRYAIHGDVELAAAPDNEGALQGKSVGNNVGDLLVAAVQTEILVRNYASHLLRKRKQSISTKSHDAERMFVIRSLEDAFAKTCVEVIVLELVASGTVS